ncbi:hypothetical protein SASPL_104274 [Salvia splendens]|uniref:Uncharacterized protein n=1 Tax=Salvia splendens TaxID=180675 RepID=A0A8X8YGW2_SALSN|nr:hypothetical protein SASPL_104274 [Salvia splendens]
MLHAGKADLQVDVIVKKATLIICLSLDVVASFMLNKSVPFLSDCKLQLCFEYEMNSAKNCGAKCIKNYATKNGRWKK